MIKVLLTGASGQVGHEIVRTLPHDVKLFSYDRKALDITSMDAIKQAINACSPDYVINAAAYTAVDRAENEAELAYAVNAMGALNLADVCHKHAIPLIHLSTDYVFDGLHRKPYDETDIPSPIGVYGKSKWEGEEAIRETLPEHIILRTSWVFGQKGHNFVKTMLHLAKEQPQLHVVSDQFGRPTAAYDLALTIWKMIDCIAKSKKNLWGTYHFANEYETSWYEFAKEIMAIASQYTNLVTQDIIAIMSRDYPTLAMRPPYSVLNCQKITQCFQINPRPWMQGLNDVIKSLSS